MIETVSPIKVTYLQSVHEDRQVHVCQQVVMPVLEQLARPVHVIYLLHPSGLTEEERDVLKAGYPGEQKMIILTSPVSPDQILDMQTYAPIVVSAKYAMSFPSAMREAVKNHLPHVEPDISSLLAVRISNLKEKKKRLSRIELNGADIRDSFKPQEIEVLQAILDGSDTKQISEDLYKAHSTVNTTLSKIYRKMNVTCRTAVITECIKRGWVLSVR
ncbi:response regulator transcription factor [Alkalicoccus luteus]|uniref:response regulator transcription factor n=1 Tax=Alkalicoccus luteus TaxID=1237094 RepID=UPI00403428ED